MRQASARARACHSDEYRWTAIVLAGLGLLRWLNSWGMITAYLSNSGSIIALVLLNTGTVLLIACFVRYGATLAELNRELSKTQGDPAGCSKSYRAK